MNEIRKALAEYANGAKDRYALEDWIALNLQAILNSSDAKELDLVDELQALIVRIGESIAEESELDERVATWLRDAETRTIPVPSSFEMNVLTEESNETVPLRNPFRTPNQDVRLRWPGQPAAV